MVLKDISINKEQQVQRYISNKFIMSSPQSSSPNSQYYSRSSAKRLFSSVFSIIDQDCQVSTFYQQSNPQFERGNPFDELLQNAIFLGQLQNRIQQSNLYNSFTLPILKLSSCDALEYNDVLNAFGSFGNLQQIVLRSAHSGYVFFSDMSSAYMAYKVMSYIGVGVRWAGWDWDIAAQIQEYTTRFDWGCYKSISREIKNKQNKLTCRYDIQIENQKEFQVSRRIIGPKGCYMKKILEEVSDLHKENHSQANVEVDLELLKLRLRGRGSGYKEGPEQVQSEECLHLCISAKNEIIYGLACGRVEQLLQRVYEEYEIHTKGNKLKVKKMGLEEEDNCATNNTMIAASNTANNNGNSIKVFAGDDGLISIEKINELLEMRNKARRELNFAEADRIRNYLRSKGVCLIDEKGRRGKATDVTTWKYMY